MIPEHQDRPALTAPADASNNDRDHDDRRRRCAAHFMATYGLTAAEAEIAAALADGARAPQIAESRNVSMNTLRAQRRTAYSKLGVADQVDLVHALSRLWPKA